MNAIVRGIKPHLVPKTVVLYTPEYESNQNVTESDPARNVMTDFAKVTPFQIESSASMEAINNKMIACGVRLLFVNNFKGELIGIITADDILGKKPLLHITQHGGSRDDISARDLMTPIDKLEGIPLAQVMNSQVSDILAILKEYRRQHMLVLDHRGNTVFVRGLFSVTQVGKQLGIEINPSLRAESFAQLKRALG